jgi:hypothetical protein
MAGYAELGNEPSGSTKSGKFPDQQSNHKVFKEDNAP